MSATLGLEPWRAEPWHALDVARAAELLGTDLELGLPEEEARERLRRFGPNQLAEKPPPPAWRVFLRQFQNGLVALLALAAGLAWVIGDHLDAAAILVVIGVNAALGFLQEQRAAQAAQALKRMLATRCRVRRGGEVRTIPSARLVPGDVVLLEAGDRVPADGRLVAAHALEIDESTLTGESHPVAKRARIVLPDDVPLADRVNMAFMNTMVTRGRGELLVTATGMRTEIGRVSRLLEETEEGPTPLQRELDRLGKRIAAVATGVVALVFALGWLRGDEPVQLVLTAISLAVAAIPEGLPAVVTITLALGMHRMARKRAIVKRLAAVETLGCTTLICSDKTGTLTQNRMAVRSVFAGGRRLDWREKGEPLPLDPRVLEPLLLAAALCNDAVVHGEEGIGDPTELALLTLAERHGLARNALESRAPRVAELPFDSERKLMATLHPEGPTLRLWVKGAAEALLPRCSRVRTAEGDVPLDEAARARIEAAQEEMAAAGLRVLALATRTIDAASWEDGQELEACLDGLTFLGLVGLLDPPRPEARHALALCRTAGIAVKMVTGDHPRTAEAIARELGFEGETLTGPDLDRMEDKELQKRLERIAVFARTVPEHKVRIVRAARARGHVVAMTGDGVNDAPALRLADIGVAMGRSGTEVAKEAAAMILADDNFATIVRAVREGRTIYDNICKFVRFQLGTNFGALLSVLAAPFAGLPLPFNAIQILWVNVIMDGPPALALGLDPPTDDIMRRPPRRPDEAILTRPRLVRLAFHGSIMAAGTLGVLGWALAAGPPERALTLGFTTFVFFQIANALNARVERGSAFNHHLFANWRLWAALAAVVVLQLVAVNWGPAQKVFHTAELEAPDLAVAAAVASSLLLVEEARKLVARLLR